MNRFNILSRARLLLLSAAALLLSLVTVNAGSTVLSINSGDTSTTWFVKDEPALVINGFDLSALPISYPITIDAVRFSVVSPVLGQPVTLVIYEDPNGGSPQDAVLLRRETVSINTTGVVRVPLSQPLVTSSKILWAGFYLPVDFRFRADASGTSVLTYWGWTPSSTFDVGNLASAAIFGPADGSAPVNINMNGIARISIEFDQADGRTFEGSAAASGGLAPVGVQIVGDPAQVSLNLMRPYEECPGLSYDPDDLLYTRNDGFTVHCRVEYGPYAPGTFSNIADVPTSIPSFEIRGTKYHVFANGNYEAPGGQPGVFKIPVTHCMKPAPGDLEKAVIGVAYGAPQAWRILPTVRFGDSICAELIATGPVSYFVPRTGNETYLNVNLFVTNSITFTPALADLRCKDVLTINWHVYNQGFGAAPATEVLFQNVSVRTGQVTSSQLITIPPIAGGETRGFETKLNIPSAYINEANRIIITLDPNGKYDELNEADNVRTFDYILQERASGC